MGLSVEHFKLSKGLMKPEQVLPTILNKCVRLLWREHWSLPLCKPSGYSFAHAVVET
jgi:hypothetical protein